MPCPKEIRLNNLIIPTYEVLQEAGGSCDLDSIIDSLITKLSLKNNVVDMLHKNSSQTELEYQLAWIKTYFKKLEIIIPDKKIWILSPKHRDLSSQQAYDMVHTLRANEQKKALAARRSKANKGTVRSSNESSELDVQETFDPLNWKEKLSNVLTNMNAYAFERLSRLLVQECGFTHVVVTKKSGDGGIDGYGKLKINGIFSFNVAFQCKRYSGTVPTKDIRDFRGSLSTDIEKGIFITTGKFSNEAQKEACDKGKKQIDLIDGDEFMEKLAEFGIGVKPITTYEIDELFFEKI